MGKLRIINRCRQNCCISILRNKSATQLFREKKKVCRASCLVYCRPHLKSPKATSLNSSKQTAAFLYQSVLSSSFSNTFFFRLLCSKNELLVVTDIIKFLDLLLVKRQCAKGDKTQDIRYKIGFHCDSCLFNNFYYLCFVCEKFKIKF